MPKASKSLVNQHHNYVHVLNEIVRPPLFSKSHSPLLFENNTLLYLSFRWYHNTETLRVHLQKSCHLFTISTQLNPPQIGISKFCMTIISNRYKKIAPYAFILPMLVLAHLNTYVHIFDLVPYSLSRPIRSTILISLCDVQTVYL